MVVVESVVRVVPAADGCAVHVIAELAVDADILLEPHMGVVGRAGDGVETPLAVDL